MNNKLFIGGLAWATDNDSLTKAFEGFGELVECKVIVDRMTGKSKGFGFVTFKTSEQASAAMDSMNGQSLDGRTIKIDFASERPASDGPRRSHGGGGDRGGDFRGNRNRY